MDKAEEFAISVTDSLIRKWVSEGKITDAVRVVGLIKECVMLGYRQAEQDTALTWEDMMRIHKHIKDAMNYHLYELQNGIEGQQKVYQNVLDRFIKEKEKEV